MTTHFTSTKTTYVTPTIHITNGTTPTPIRKCIKKDIREHYIDDVDCKSKVKITKSSCHGDCQSTVISDFIRGLTIRNCSCCKPVGVYNSTIKLNCPNGNSKVFIYKRFKECFCRPCDRSPFNDVPLWH